MKIVGSVVALLITLTLGAEDGAKLKLPAPDTAGGATLLTALWGRKTVRTLAGPALTLPEASRLLWAAQGENRPGKRAVPSARGKYPLELYLTTSGSATLPAGLYHYLPSEHQVVRSGDGGPAALLGKIKGMQSWISNAPEVFVVAGDTSRLGGGEYGLSYTFYEGGAAAQDLLLQATALGLGAGTAAGVDLAAVAQALKLPAGNRVLVLLPVGH
jgi:SagB-type dehydrogenase family enzyme